MRIKVARAIARRGHSNVQEIVHAGNFGHVDSKGKVHSPVGSKKWDNSWIVYSCNKSRYEALIPVGSVKKKEWLLHNYAVNEY